MLKSLIIALVLLTASLAAGSPAAAGAVHGIYVPAPPPAMCSTYTGFPTTDGCSGANPYSSFQNANFVNPAAGSGPGVIGWAINSGPGVTQPTILNTHPATWNMSCVDYPCGPDSRLTLLDSSNSGFVTGSYNASAQADGVTGYINVTGTPTAANGGTIAVGTLVDIFKTPSRAQGIVLYANGDPGNHCGGSPCSGALAPSAPSGTYALSGAGSSTITSGTNIIYWGLPATCTWTETMSGGATGVAASATETFGSNPSANQYIVIDSVVWTFVASGASGNQTNIQGSLSATLTQLANDLNASSNASIALATYGASGNVLTITYGSTGTGGNAYTLGPGTAAPTLTHIKGPQVVCGTDNSTIELDLGWSSYAANLTNGNSGSPEASPFGLDFGYDFSAAFGHDCTTVLFSAQSGIHRIENDKFVANGTVQCQQSGYPTPFGIFFVTDNGTQKVLDAEYDYEDGGYYLTSQGPNNGWIDDNVSVASGVSKPLILKYDVMINNGSRPCGSKGTGPQYFEYLYIQDIVLANSQHGEICDNGGLVGYTMPADPNSGNSVTYLNITAVQTDYKNPHFSFIDSTSWIWDDWGFLQTLTGNFEIGLNTFVANREYPAGPAPFGYLLMGRGQDGHTENGNIYIHDNWVDPSGSNGCYGNNPSTQPAGVQTITVTNGGSYSGTPTATFTGGGGTGTNGGQPTVTVNMSGGAVASVTVLTPGNDTTTPTVGFTGGSGSGAAATAQIYTWSLANNILSVTNTQNVNNTPTPTYIPLNTGNILVNTNTGIFTTPQTLGAPSTLGTGPAAGNACTITTLTTIINCGFATVGSNQSTAANSTWLVYDGFNALSESNNFSLKYATGNAVTTGFNPAVPNTYKWVAGAGLGTCPGANSTSAITTKDIQRLMRLNDNEFDLAA